MFQTIKSLIFNDPDLIVRLYAKHRYILSNYYSNEIGSSADSILHYEASDIVTKLVDPDTHVFDIDELFKEKMCPLLSAGIDYKQAIVLIDNAIKNLQTDVELQATAERVSKYAAQNELTKAFVDKAKVELLKVNTGEGIQLRY